MTGIARRVERLERAAGEGGKPFVVVVAGDDEPEVETIRRIEAEQGPVSGSDQIVIVRNLVRRVVVDTGIRRSPEWGRWGGSKV